MQMTAPYFQIHPTQKPLLIQRDCPVQLCCFRQITEAYSGGTFLQARLRQLRATDGSGRLPARGGVGRRGKRVGRPAGAGPHGSVGTTPRALWRKPNAGPGAVPHRRYAGVDRAGAVYRRPELAANTAGSYGPGPGGQNLRQSGEPEGRRCLRRNGTFSGNPVFYFSRIFTVLPSHGMRS